MLRNFFLILVLACPLFAGDASEGVREAADGWRAALVKQDKAGLDRYLADELIYIHAGGKTQTKAEYIEAVTTGPSRYESFNKTDIKIRVYDKVAVLSGYIDVKTVGRRAADVLVAERAVVAGARARGREERDENAGVATATDHGSSWRRRCAASVATYAEPASKRALTPNRPCHTVDTTPT